MSVSHNQATAIRTDSYGTDVVAHGASLPTPWLNPDMAGTKLACHSSKSASILPSTSVRTCELVRCYGAVVAFTYTPESSPSPLA